MASEDIIAKLLANAYSYQRGNQELIVIKAYDINEKSFIGVGQETGELFEIMFSDVNLELDTFYVLTPIKISEV